jgi:hypothetical protein
VIKLIQPGSGAGFKINLYDFACEHMEVDYFLYTNMPVQGLITGHWIVFTQNSQTATISQNANTLTCTANGPYGGTEFFHEGMVGKIIDWGGSVTATITAVATDRKSATAADSKTVTAATGTLTDPQGYRRPSIYRAANSAGGVSGQIQIKMVGCAITNDATFGTPNPVGTRMALLDAPATVSTQHKLSFENTTGVTACFIMGGNNTTNQSRTIDLVIDNPNPGAGGVSSATAIRAQYRFTGAYKQDANGYISLAAFFADPELHTGVEIIRRGKVLGGFHCSDVNVSYRVTTIAARTNTLRAVAGTPILQAGRHYFGAPIVYHSSNVLLSGFGTFHGLAVGTPANPFQFGYIPNGNTLANSATQKLISVGGPFNPWTATDLRLTGIYNPPGTLSQTGTTITASDSQAFGTRTTPANLQTGAKIYWMVNGVITATATLSSVTDATHAQVSETQAVPAGTAYIEYPMASGKLITIMPTWMQAYEDLTSYEVNRNATLPAMDVT